VLLSDPARILLTFGLGILFSVVLTPVARHYARRAGLVAKPKADRWHKKATALMGGPAIVVATLGAFFALFGSGTRTLIWAWLAGAVAIALVGVYDDIRELRPTSKLIAQIIAALVPIALGLTIPGFHPLLSFWIAAFWIVGITNAFNLLDNMDGLSAGIAAIAAAVLAIHAYQAGDLSLTAAAAALSGASVGFLFYNFQPASIFMGDGGSLFLGYSLGTLSLLRTPARPLVSLSIIAVPLFVLAIPIFDTTLVAVLRILNGRAFHQGGCDHSSHRLVSLGLSERRAVTTLYAIAAATGLTSLLLPRLPSSLIVLCVLVAVLGIYYFGATLGSVVVYGKSSSEFAEARARGNFILDTFVQHKQRIMDVIADLTVVAISYLSAYLLRYEGVLSPLNLELILDSLPFLIAIRLVCFFAVGLYRTVPGAFSIHDFLATLKAVLLSSTVFVTGLVLFTRFQEFSRAVMVIDAVFTVTGVVFARIALHSLKEVFRGFDRTERRGVLVVGAGTLGEAATRLITADESGRYRIVGFLDDSPDKIGRSLHGYAVLGSLREAEQVLSSSAVALVVFASSRIPAAERERLKALCRRLSVDVQDVTIR
jgi:UDP-GlcNAc:undecaprenyl-phosphate/decaprenyl-phosphate GlcNAc-1-phosphate transferase